jgi:serine/threonine protein kinase
MGLSDDTDDEEKGFAGTPGYIAPEMYQFYDEEIEDYDEGVDIWSVGMLMLDLLAVGQFDRAEGASAGYQILLESDLETDEEADEYDTSVVLLREGAAKTMKKIWAAEGVKGEDKGVVALLKKFLTVNPDKRSSAREILEGKVLSSVEPKEEYMDMW